MTKSLNTSPQVLILGATGSFGGAAARVFLAKGWRVRAMTRRPAAHPVEGLSGVDWVAGDAMNASEVLRAAQGVQYIVHAVNPPGYRHWEQLGLPMLDHSIAAAKASGARLVLPGNVYNFGPDAGALVSESSPQHPLTRKGRVRVEMEARLRAAAGQGVRSLVLRCGDFFGAPGHSSWFDHLWIKPGKRFTRLSYPGVHEVSHAWAYVPDAAEALFKLLDLDAKAPERLASFEVLHFAGHGLANAVAMPQAVARAMGQPDLPIKGVPWGVMRALSPLVPFLRELVEMRYLWQVPLLLDNRKLISLIGPEPHTPLDVAVRASLGLGANVQAQALQPASAG
jgi:nucleoside-diphosphate-sugar epimerase